MFVPRKTLLFLLAFAGLAGNADAASWQDTHKAFRVGFLSTNGAAGKSLAVTGEDSIAGRLVPLKYLSRAGLDLTSRAGSLVTVGDPAAAVAALQSRTADLAVAWSSMTGDPAAGYDFGVLNTL